MERSVALDGQDVGTLINPTWKPMAQFSTGLLATFMTAHRISVLVMSQRKGDFLMADSRGKLYHCVQSSNSFEVVKKATVSGPVCCAAFVESKSGVALLAYSNGSVLVFDLNAKRTIASLQTPSGVKAKLIRCHPTKLMMVTADEQNNLSVWDLRLMSSTLGLACQEAVVDVQFVENGQLLVVVLEKSGIHVYRSADMKVVLRCPFPDSERKPKWSAFAFAPSTLPGSLRFLLAGDNCQLYLFETDAPFDVSAEEEEKEPPLCSLLGVVDLPVTIKLVSAMVALGEPTLQPQVLLLSDDGNLCIVDAQGFGGGSIGIWTVVAELRGAVTLADGGTLATSPKSSFFALCGSDGACRLFDPALALGTGASVATMLHARGPYPSTSRVPVYRVVDGRGQRVEVHKEGPAIAVRKRVGIKHNDKRPNTAENDRKEREREARARREAREQEKEKEKQKTSQKKKKEDKKERERQHSETMKRYSEVGDLEEMQPVERAEGGGDQSHHSQPALSQAHQHVRLPLHEMALHNVPSDKHLTEAKLRTYLATHHELPARYRQVVWRFLLKLPENSVAFADLAHRGPHKAFDRLHEKYPIRSRRLFQRLHSACSQLAHWSPIFGEVSYLPQLVFPFTIVFGVDELATLEAVMTILMWWGYSWHATFPQPPVHIIDCIDRILHLGDAKLYNHLVKRDVPPGVAGWALVSSFFTEVLSRENWLRLMDLIFLNTNKTAAMYIAPVALMIAMRSTLLALDDPDQIMTALRTQHNFEFAFVSKVITSLLSNTPSKVLSGAAVKSRYDDDYSSSNRAHDLDEVDQARECLALQGGHPVFPLTSGRYPAYDGYPKYLLDWQLRDRKAALELDDNMGVTDENVLDRLKLRVEAINDTHRDWTSQREDAARREEAARVAAAQKEKHQLFELQRIEEEIAKQRIMALSAQERSAQEQMGALQALRRETEGMMRLSEEQMLERASLTLNLQKQRELAEAAESSAIEKLNSMHLRRSKEEWVKAVERSLEDREKELNARDRLLQEQQKRMEEEAQLRREERRRRTEFQKEEEALIGVHTEMTAKMQKMLLTRETDVVELSRQRQLRQAQEQADEALESAQRSQHLLHKQEASALLEAQARATAEGSQRSKKGYEDMLQVIRSDGDRAAREERTKVIQGKLGAEKPAVAASAVALQEQMAARVEQDVLKKVTLSAAMQDRELSRLGSAEAAVGGQKGGYMSDESSIDNILAPLGDQVKREIMRSREAPSSEGGGDLDDSALWAYDDPQNM